MRQLFGRVTLFITIFSLFAVTGQSQVWKLRRYEMSAGIGIANYFGDIGGYSPGDNLLGLKDLSFQSTRPMLHVGMRYKLYEIGWLNFNLSFGALHGSDAGGVNERRGIEFRTFLVEPSLRYEQAIINGRSNRSYLMMKGRGISSFANSLSVYVFAGLGAAILNVRSLEDPYNRMNPGLKVTLSIPAGAAVRFALDPNWDLGFEVGPHYTTTDYADGFTSPQYSKFNDVYFFTSVHVIWKLRTSRKNLPIFRF
ncbi:MAG: hypothetical protein J7K46_07355 [Bacteroidales bacterium]|nr:hypothetical protein [Bacteroidales bacterium]